MSNSGTAVPSRSDPGLEENGLAQNFLRRLRTGIHLDKAIILAIAEEKVLRRIFALCPQDPVVADPHIGLIDVFGAAHDGLWVARPSRALNEEVIFPIPSERRVEAGQPVIVTNVQVFELQWSIFTERMFTNFEWENVVVAGGSVLACLERLSAKVQSSNAKTRHHQRTHYPKSDIDIFLYNLSAEDAERRIISIYETIKGVVPFDTLCVRTKNTISIHSQHPFRVVQVVLRLYHSVAEVLAGFDIDSACFAYDGQRVWSNPRGLTALMRQSNTVDMSRRSPSYENRLAKFAARGYEVRVPTLKRDNIDPKIYSLRPSHLHGLALLLYLENQMVLETRKLRSPSGDHIRGVHTQVVDEAIASVSENRESNYAHFRVPYGPGWTADKIESHILNADFVLNSETMHGVYINSYEGDGWQLHRHPAFVGTAQECIRGTCQGCAEPRTSQELALRTDWDKKYVRGRIRFFEDDPGRQCISGSFNPIDVGDWSAQAYSHTWGQEQASETARQGLVTTRKTLDLLKKSAKYTRKGIQALENMLQNL